VNIALAADPAVAAPVAERFARNGHACLPVGEGIPAEADCLVLLGEPAGAEALVAAAEEAGIKCLRLPAASSPDCGAIAAEAAAWALSIADEQFMDAVRSDARVKRLEDIRVKMAEQRNTELAAANELLKEHAEGLKDALKRLDGANRQLMDELNLASELQKSLLPRAYPPDAPLEFAHKFAPLNTIGGDFFDVLRLDERTLALVIADVSGHGVGPALVTAMFKSSFGLVSKTLRSPAALMTALNAEMNNFLTTGHYVTAFTAFIDLESLEMRFCSAGHPNQILFRADGRSEELATMGFLLGMIEGMDYEEKSVTLEPGDTLVLFTDGVFEAPDSEGRLFGREGIIRSLSARLGAGPDELSNGVFSDLLDWSEGTEATDDVTLLLAQVLASL
jgi:serine phosphatase RsbU (regulator of sigma subunit)